MNDKDGVAVADNSKLFTDTLIQSLTFHFVRKNEFEDQRTGKELQL